MKQVLQYRRSGATRVMEVPAPVTPGAGLLVQNEWSLISPGTERMLVEAGGGNLLNTARQRPDLVRQVVDKAARDGIAATVEAVRSRLDVAIPLGYSCAGTVLDVGSQALADFAVGDRVACAGAGQANHAEIVAVARNLTVRVPHVVSLADAAFVTVGAIALQGVRIADVRLGEACVVIGLGLVGQLTVQLLKAAGCRVFGIDVAPDKVKLALANGADAASLRSDADLVERVKAFSLGRGADAILITAAANTSDPVQVAPSLARDRAVVVAVGLIGLDVPRNAYYEKEMQLRLSRSYGPGRYDKTYEEDGVDYPVGYVRWTEQRNMEAFLDLVAAGTVRPSQLVTHHIPIAEAERAYQIVTGEIAEPSLGILLEYPHTAPAEAPIQTRVDFRRPLPRTSGTVRLGVIGAGSFARSVLLPALKKLDVELRGVVTASAPSAQQTATRYGFGYVASDWRQVVDDDTVDAVVIATRHDLHAQIAAAALRAGKAVFVEKPLALTSESLDDVMAAWRQCAGVLQVGFNRRFAPTYVQLKRGLGSRRGPLTMAYRVNAGAVASSSWVVDPIQGGGRLVGEVCHMVDLLVDLCGAPVTTVYAQPRSWSSASLSFSQFFGRGADDDAAALLPSPLQAASAVVPATSPPPPPRVSPTTLPEASPASAGSPRSPIAAAVPRPLASGDDILLTLTFADGSLATIVYASGGDRAMPKEQLEVLGNGTSAVLDDFRRLRVYLNGSEKRFGGRLATQDKGHAAELAAFLEAVRHGQPSPVDPEQAEHVTRVTFAALASARGGLPIDV